MATDRSTPASTKNSDRERALESALQHIEKAFGKGSVMCLGQGERDEIAVIPTGSLSLDIALGVGGLPRGRIIEIYGTESSGKTTLALHVIAEAQRKGGMALFVDAEHALDVEYARSLGVDIEKLYISQPTSGEEALEIMDAMIRSGAMDVVVLDSVAALVPKAEIEGEMGDAFVGIQARMMSQALRKLGGSISKSKTVAIFINQLREKIGVMYGNPETTPGGRALKFWLPFAWRSAEPTPSKSGPSKWGREQRSRSSRTRSRHPSGWPNSTFSTARESASRAMSSMARRTLGS
ncbi:MAG: recombinase RecA [Armatimonadetes bacterium OLB18]|nr:MAG: recombinase RecA [Armatimonadetes bacterium OLB18]